VEIKKKGYLIPLFQSWILPKDLTGMTEIWYEKKPNEESENPIGLG